MVGQLYHNSWTFTTDDARILADLPLIFTELDIQILLNDALMGDVNGQNFELSSGDIVSYRSSRGIALKQFFFKNAGAGNNIKVVVNGILL
jgi:hypothetical protein